MNCSYCSVLLNNKIDLNNHIRNLHPDIKESCIICNESFLLIELKNFKSNEVGGVKLQCSNCLDKNKCDMCNKIVLSKNFKRHYSNCITNNQEYKCDKCNIYFKKNVIKKHYNRCNNGLRKCNKCKERKTIDNFYASKYQCKECLKEKQYCYTCNRNILTKIFNSHKCNLSF